jgi:hypothetical protein
MNLELEAWYQLDLTSFLFLFFGGIGLYRLRHSTIFVLGILEIGSHELFAWAGI